MKIVFLGTPTIAVPTLEKLAASGHSVLLAVSQPDRPSGRGKLLRPTPVKEAAIKLGIPVFQPETVNAPESVRRIADLNPEVIVVVAFGQILKQELLGIPPRGCINLHASLLPLLRGAAPINRAIMEGHAVTGLTTMRMDRGMDTGDMYLKVEIPITPRTTAGDLHDAMMVMGADLVAETLRGIGTGGFAPVPQDPGKATYAPKISPDERAVDWHVSAVALDRRIRGLSPSPGAFTFFRGKRVLLLRSTLGAGTAPRPGSIRAGAGHLEVGTGNGTLLLLEVCPEGKNPMAAAEWARGVRLSPDDGFGSV